MINTRILAAWPNWFLIPAMLAFWVALGVLAAEMFGAAGYHRENG